MLFFYKFSSRMEIVVLLILFRQHFFFYFILGTMVPSVVWSLYYEAENDDMEEGIPALIASAKQWRLFKRSFDIFSCRSSHHVKNRFHFPIFTLHKCSHLHFCFKHIHTTTTYLVHSMKYWEWAAHMFLYCCFLLASNNSQLKEICNMISDRSMQKNDRRVKDFFFW